MGRYLLLGIGLDATVALVLAARGHPAVRIGVFPDAALRAAPYPRFIRRGESPRGDATGRG